MRHAAQIAEQRARAAVELVVEAFDGGLVEDAFARDSHSGQRSTMRQWRGPSSDQSSGYTSSPAQWKQMCS